MMAQKNKYRYYPKSKQRKQEKLDPNAMKISLDDLAISDSTKALLEKNKINNAAQLIIKTDKDMYKMQTLNKKILNEISFALKKHKLSFKVEDKQEKVQNPNQKTNANAKQPNPNQKNTANKNVAKNIANKNTAKVDNKNLNKNRNLQNQKQNKSQKTNKPKEEFINLNPSGKIDFLLTKCSKRAKTKVFKLDENKKRKGPLKSPLPIGEWKKVQRGSKWGFNNGMKTIIQPTYDEVFMFKEDLACVELNNKYGYIDKDNKFFIPCTYDMAFSFSEDLAVVMVNEKCGYINKKNEIVIGCEFDAATPFEDGVARVKLDGKWGFLTKDGKIRWK